MERYYSNEIKRITNNASERIKSMLFYPLTIWHPESDDKKDIIFLPYFKSPYGDARVTRVVTWCNEIICEGVLEGTFDEVHCPFAALDDSEKCLLADFLEPLY